jgi:Mn2+/Fe2+ NRAMP family transporter
VNLEQGPTKGQAEAATPEADGPAVARRPRLRLPGLRRSGMWLYLAALGPGIIASFAGDEASGITTYSSVGAQYGYDLLWVMLIATISLMVMQEQAARAGAITGKGFADLVREQFGVRWTAFAMLVLLIANTGITIAEFVGIGAALELFGVPRWISLPLVAFALWWLLTKGNYKMVERIFLLMSTVFLAYFIAMFMAKPDWGAVAAGTFVPSFRADPAYIYLLIATIGTTLTPYMQLFEQSSVVDKGVTAADYKMARFDAYAGAIFANLIAAAIIIVTAATLHPIGQQVNNMNDAALALAPVAGEYAKNLFAVGLFGASMLAAGVLPIATAYSVCEAFGFEKGVSYTFREAPVFNGLFTALIVIGATVAIIPGLPIAQLLVATQVLNGMLMPVILIFMLLIVNNKDIMGKYANTRFQNIVAWPTAIVIILLSIFLLVSSLIFPLFGINFGQ